LCSSIYFVCVCVCVCVRACARARVCVCVCVHSTTPDKKQSFMSKEENVNLLSYFCFELTKDISHKYCQILCICNSVRFGILLCSFCLSIFLVLLQGTQNHKAYDVNFQALISSNCSCVSTKCWCLILLSVNMAVCDWQDSEYHLCEIFQSQET
jgi:hypothetical protein